MIPFDDALQLIEDRSSGPGILRPAETVPLILSDRRTLSEEIVAGENVPGYDNSAMDGYAIRADDTVGATPEQPRSLAIVDEAPAESPSDRTLQPGEAMAIMTGGAVPHGADAVVMVERTRRDGDRLFVEVEVSPGTAIRSAGEDMTSGTRLLPAGRIVTPSDIGALGTLGITNVPVRTRPIVALLSTGSELVEPHEASGPGRIRNSSGPALLASLARMGAETVDLGICGDDRDELAEMIETGLRCDIFLTSGGVSAGSYDHVQHLLPEAGVDVAFHGVAVKPGKPLLFGTLDEAGTRTFVFGLPGNPVSSLVTSTLFVRPLIDRMLGRPRSDRSIVATLDGEYAKRDEKRHFVRVRLDHSGDGLPRAEPVRTQSSGAISSLVEADGLMIVPEETTSLEHGSVVRVHPTESL